MKHFTPFGDPALCIHKNKIIYFLQTLKIRNGPQKSQAHFGARAAGICKKNIKVKSNCSCRHSKHEKTSQGFRSSPLPALLQSVRHFGCRHIVRHSFTMRTV